MSLDFTSILKGINLNTIATNTNKTLNVIKKTIPIYKEVRPYLKKEKSIFNTEIKEEIPLKDISSNNNITFFH